MNADYCEKLTELTGKQIVNTKRSTTPKGYYYCKDTWWGDKWGYKCPNGNSIANYYYNGVGHFQVDLTPLVSEIITNRPPYKTVSSSISHTPFTTITSNVVFDSLYIVITGKVDLKYDGYFHKYDNTKTKSWKPSTYNWRMDADILPENPNDEGFSKGISLTIIDEDHNNSPDVVDYKDCTIDKYHIVYDKNDGTWRCGITLPHKGNYMVEVKALLHNKKNIPVIVQTVTMKNILVNDKISIDIAKASDASSIILAKSNVQKVNFSTLYSSNYITKSIKNINKVQPENTLWKITRLKANMKDADGNDTYKYNIINLSTNKSLLNNIEVKTKTILDPFKEGSLFFYKNTDIFDNLMLDLEPVKEAEKDKDDKETGNYILQKDKNGNQKYFIKFTVQEDEETKYKYLSVTDKGVLIARDKRGYTSTDEGGIETIHYNEFVIIPKNNKSNLDKDSLIKNLDYVGITSVLTPPIISTDAND